MDALLRVGLANTAWAAALAIVAWCAARVWKRRPALAHLLWIVVLLKLATPSLVSLRWPGRAPAAFRVARAELATGVAHHQPTPPTPFKDPEPATRASDAPAPPTPGEDARRATRFTRQWRSWLAILWLLGGAAWWATVGLYARRVGQFVRAAQPAPAELTVRAERLAASLGLGACPAIGIVPARIPPMLWALFGPPRLLLPEALWKRLGRAQQDTVLVHELAHLKRGDHWVRRLEVLVLGLHWWNPLAWWARREVERAEEPCCDVWVAWGLPGSADDYAEALVATAAFLSGPRPFRPVGASGVGRARLLKRRLNMILSDSPSARGAPRAALLLAALCVPLLPVWAARGDDRKDAPPAAPEPKKALGGSEEKREAAQVDAPARTAHGPVHPVVREVSDYVSFHGRVEPVQSVELLAPVSGPITGADVKTGALVKREQLIVTIDERVYRAELVRAEAELRRAEARKREKVSSLAHTEELSKKNVVSQQSVAQFRIAVEEADAELTAAQATRDLARLKLDSARVTSPIDGRVTFALGAGNTAVADRTRIATVVQLDPIAVSFDVDERTALRVGRLLRAGKLPGATNSEVPVVMALADEADFPHRGKVLSTDTEFDANTGTTRWRALFPNADRALVPGLFARVQIATSPPHQALLVPQRAVFYDDRSRPYVSVLSPAQPGGVVARSVKLGQMHGEYVVVLEGQVSPADALHVEPEQE